MQDRLFRALAILRVVLLANTIGLNLLRRENFEHPTAGLLVVLGLAVWTGVAIWAYADPARRTPPLLVTDLLVAVAGLAVTPWVKGPDFNATVAGFWVMGAMFAWAIQWRWAGGLTAAVVLCAADLAIRDTFTQSNYGNLFLLMIGGPIIGYVCESLQRSAMAVAAAERTAATEAERARLARAVHDGVLQVLALVQRRGGELGGEAGELGRLAGEQEIRLRALIRAQDSVVPPAFGDADGRVDLAMELARFEEHGSVTVSLPGPPVPLPARTVDEIVAAVSACLDNVLLHVGRSAPAWVLLEAFPDRVVVSVRDEGPGIPAGRLEAAQGDGRLGVVDSIRGRIVELGGTAELTTGTYGTEWELTVPRSLQSRASQDVSARRQASGVTLGQPAARPRTAGATMPTRGRMPSRRRADRPRLAHARRGTRCRPSALLLGQERTVDHRAEGDAHRLQGQDSGSSGRGRSDRRAGRLTARRPACGTPRTRCRAGSRRSCRRRRSRDQPAPAGRCRRGRRAAGHEPSRAPPSSRGPEPG